MVKFGKDITGESLTKWEDNYVDYSRLKKLINKEVFSSVQSDETEETSGTLQEIFQRFDNCLKEELDKVDEFYKMKCEELHSKIENIGQQNSSINSYQDSYKDLDELRHLLFN